MTPFSIVLVAFALALVVMSLAFMGGAVPVAIPLALIVIAFVGWSDFRRRRQQAQTIASQRDRAKAKDVEFTDRDRETLVSE